MSTVRITENLLSLPRWWSYSPSPGQQPEQRQQHPKTNSHEYTPLNHLCSVKLLLLEILPTGLHVICAHSNASPDVAMLQMRHIQCSICKAADSDNVLLEQLNDADELHMSVEEVRRCLCIGRMS
jgi:hypothetical protein